jgi:acylphosphatase
MKTIRSVKGFVCGRVQGVGFRYFVKRQAQSEQLCGTVRNLPDGRVEFLLQGPPAAVARVIEQIRSGPAYARVNELTVEDFDDIDAGSGFTIC